MAQRNSNSRPPRHPHQGKPHPGFRGPPKDAWTNVPSPKGDRGETFSGHRQNRPSRPPSGGQVWLWGRHPVLAVLANEERKIRRFLAVRGEEASLPADLPIRPELVDRDVIARTLPGNAVHQGLAVLVDQLPETSLADILTQVEGQERTVIVALDQVTDPHNVGAITRSAAALGATAIVMTEAHAPASDGVLAKSASGALERISIARVPNLVGAFDKLKAEGFWIAGLDAEGTKTLAEAALSGRIVLVLGAEGAGLRRLTRERCDWLVRIPLSGAVESLNVSAAAACALYELARLAR